MGECLAIYGPYYRKGHKRGGREMVFSFAKVWDNKNLVLSFEEHKANRSYSRMNTAHWAESEVKKARSRRFILAYVMMFLSGGGIDWYKLGVLYRPDSVRTSPARTAKYIFKQEAFQRMIQQKMIQIFSGRNKTEGDVLDMLDKTFAVAAVSKDPKNMLAVTQEYIELFSMRPETTNGKQIPGYGAEDADFDEIEAAVGSAQRQLPVAAEVPAPPGK